MPDQPQKPNPDQDEDFWELDDSSATKDDQVEEEIETAIEQPAPTPEPQPESITPKKPGLTGFEKLSIAAVMAILIGLGIGYYAYFLSKYDTSDPHTYITNTPVKGTYAAIDKIDTSWTQSDDENVRLGIKIVPSATIHLDPEGSSSGTLRIVFYGTEKNSNGSLRSAGDSITVRFNNGKFKNGTSSLLVTGTDGLKTIGDFYSYRNQDDERWTVEVREADTNTTSASAFKELANAPIAPILD